jgi:6-phosphogluconolactonase (cycloisomerase 2 family)
MPSGYVLTQTNEAQDNELLAYRRDQDGRLTPLGARSTKGAGSGTPHLQSQGSVVVTGDGRHVLVANAGSGDLAVFALLADGPAHVQTIAVGGAPRSVAERNRLVYALAAGEPAVTGFRWEGTALAPITGSRRMLPDDADPAQVGFGPDGVLVVTSRGRDELLVFPVGEDGLLGEMSAVPSSGPTPYGFATTSNGVLVVTEAFGARVGEAAASSYRMAGAVPAPVTRSAKNGRSEICWAVVTLDGRFAFTTNFADGAVSRWAVGDDGTLTIEDAVAGMTQDGRKGLRDEDLTADGRFLFALDADAGELHGWAIGADGGLSPTPVAAGLPATVAGLAAW